MFLFDFGSISVDIHVYLCMPTEHAYHPTSMQVIGSLIGEHCERSALCSPISMMQLTCNLITVAHTLIDRSIYNVHIVVN